MISTQTLVNYLQTLFNSEAIADYCPNGLQVEGKKEIQHIVTGVSANLALIERAIELNADALLVHHGFFWKGEDPTLTSVKYQRIKLLIENEINLIAYHLPLDIHPLYGNNAQFAQDLKIIPTGHFPAQEKFPLGCIGKLPVALKAHELALLLEKTLQQQPRHIAAHKDTIHTVAWCTGAAQDLIIEAAKMNVDAYVSGEISERTVHLAKELNIHYFAAGHHATERGGIRALGQHLSEQFNVRHTFVDIPNPV